MREVKYFDAKHKDESEYYTVADLKKLLSYGGDVSGCQSPRNYGKSYAAMEFLREKINKGETVCWGRYNRTELSQALQTWKEHCPELIDHRPSNDNLNPWLMNEETGGKIMFFPWNRSQNLKGIDFPFTWMVCDEFVPERYTEKPRLDTEFKDWTSVYKSISRSYGTRVILMSNNIYWFNPFFLAWGVMPFSKGKILKQVDKFVANVDGVDYKTERVLVFENVAATPAIVKRNLKQQAVDFSSSEDLSKYFENETQQEYTRIAKCPDMSIKVENVQLSSQGYTMGFRRYGGDYYFFKSQPRADVYTYVSEPEYVDYAKKCVRTPKVCQFYEQIFNLGLCVFDSGETLLAFMRWVRLNRQRI